jgi:hypothetical protein
MATSGTTGTTGPTGPTGPTFATASDNQTTDNFFYQDIPLLSSVPVIQANVSTTDMDDSTKLYVKTQVYNEFEYYVSNAKNFLGTVLAAGFLVWGVSKAISKEEDDTADKISDAGYSVGEMAAIAFSAAHLLNAGVTNFSTHKPSDAKYKPKIVVNPSLEKN